MGLTFSRCSVHRSAFLNCPEMVFTFPRTDVKYKDTSATRTWKSQGHGLQLTFRIQYCTFKTVKVNERVRLL